MLSKPLRQSPFTLGFFTRLNTSSHFTRFEISPLSVAGFFRFRSGNFGFELQFWGEMASDLGYGMGLVRSTSFGRKRVFLSSQSMEFGDDDDCVRSASLKRRCSQDLSFLGEKSAIEDLPQEILVSVAVIFFDLCSYELIELVCLLDCGVDFCRLGFSVVWSMMI